MEKQPILSVPSLFKMEQRVALATRLDRYLGHLSTPFTSINLLGLPLCTIIQPHMVAERAQRVFFIVSCMLDLIPSLSYFHAFVQGAAS